MITEKLENIVKQEHKKNFADENYFNVYEMFASLHSSC